MADPLIVLITWPTYGHWLAGYGRGGAIESVHDTLDAWPEIDVAETEKRRRSLKRAVVFLRPDQYEILVSDLQRASTFRPFVLLNASFGAGYARLLIETPADVDLHRLIQLIKGSMSRALSVHERGPEQSESGPPEDEIHKWWGRQYVALVLQSETARDEAVNLIERENQEGCATARHPPRQSS